MIVTLIRRNPIWRTVVRTMDRGVPGLSKGFRRVRDHLYYVRQKPRMRPALGLALAGTINEEAMRLDEGELSVFLKHVRRADAVVDIGANVGLFSCVAARASRPVVAVEPHPNNIQLLCTNLRANGLGDVEIFSVALSGSVGIAPLFGSRQSATLLTNWGGIGGANYERLVPITTLDRLLCGRFTSKRLVIKIDVEGNEMGVLTGAGETLARSPAPVWILEHGLTENFSGINPNYLELFEVFWSRGYRAYTLDEERLEVRREDVLRWLHDGERDFGSIGFLFEK